MNTSRTERIIAFLASVCMSAAVMLTVVTLFDITPSAEAVAASGPAGTVRA